MDDIVTLGIATIDSLNDNFHDILTQDMELALTQCNKARDTAKELNYQKGDTRRGLQSSMVSPMEVRV